MGGEGPRYVEVPLRPRSSLATKLTEIPVRGIRVLRLTTVKPVSARSSSAMAGAAFPSRAARIEKSSSSAGVGGAARPVPRRGRVAARLVGTPALALGRTACSSPTRRRARAT